MTKFTVYGPPTGGIKKGPPNPVMGPPDPNGPPVFGIGPPET